MSYSRYNRGYYHPGMNSFQQHGINNQGSDMYNQHDGYPNYRGRNPRPHHQRTFTSSGNNKRRLRPNHQGPTTNPEEYQTQKRKVNDVKLSRGLAYILRHGAFDKKLNMDKRGFIYVKDILKLRGYRHVAKDDIIRIVRNNNKQRFHLQRDHRGNLMIAANQGHSIEVTQIDLKPITDAKSFNRVIHGTTYQAWESIKDEGLKTMGRTHIHFARGEPGEKGVISGMRSSSEVFIYIDLEKALASGIKFSLSRNGVILSKGDKKGTISPVFFKSVIDGSTRRSLKKKRRNTYKSHTSANTTKY